MLRASRYIPVRMVIVVAVILFGSQLFAQSPAKGKAVVQAGSRVSFDYTLTDENGKVIDTSKGREPMTYIHGQGQIIPGLEKEMAGMAVGAGKKVKIKPEDAYGPVDPRAFQEVPKEQLPPGALKVGTMLTAQGPQGESIPVRVHEIKEKSVVMDFNHPLAGKTLSFDIKITEIKPTAK